MVGAAWCVIGDIPDVSIYWSYGESCYDVDVCVAQLNVIHDFVHTCLFHNNSSTMQ